MKRFFYLLPAVALIFAACSDNDDDDNSGLGGDNEVAVNGNQITDLPGDIDIDEVRLVMYATGEHTLATAKWNDGFSLEFPETVSSSYLESIYDFFEMEDEEIAVLNISSSSVKLGRADIEAYKGDRYLGDFYMGKETATQEVYVAYCYADGAVTIKGTYTDEWGDYKDIYAYDVSLAKGWNRIASIWTEESDLVDRCTFTTSIPSGLTWMFD